MNSRPSEFSDLNALRSVDPVVHGILALGLVAGLLVVTRTWEYGIGLSPDSVWYVAMARELATGHDAFAGEHLRPAWPPLFILLIAAPALVGVDPIDAVAILNPSILVSICVVSGLWLYRRTGLGFASLIVTGVLAFSIPLTRASSFVWTEPLFVLLTLCSLVLLDRHLRDNSLVALLFAGLFAALACLTRYAGVALIASSALLVLAKPQITLKRKTLRALLYSLVAALPVSLWLLRNLLMSGTVAGGRTTGEWTFAENVERGVLTLGKWVLPWRSPDQSLDLLISGVSLLVVAGFALAWGWWSWRRRGVRDTISWLKLGDPLVLTLCAYMTVYFAFMVAVSTAIRIDAIGSRLLVPMFVPLVLVAGFVVARLIAMARRDRGGRFANTFAAAIIVFAATHVAAYVPELRRAADNGHGYASRAWETSPAIAWLRRADHHPRLLSNHADALYLLVPGVAIEPLPRGQAQLPDVVASLGDERIVWFHTTRYPYDLAEFAADLGLRRVREFDDSVVFEAPQP